MAAVVQHNGFQGSDELSDLRRRVIYSYLTDYWEKALTCSEMVPHQLGVHVALRMTQRHHAIISTSSVSVVNIDVVACAF